MSASIASCVVDTAEPTEHAVRGTADPLIVVDNQRSEEHTSELQSRPHVVCRLLLAKKNRGWHSLLECRWNRSHAASSTSGCPSRCASRTPCWTETPAAWSLPCRLLFELWPVLLPAA